MKTLTKILASITLTLTVTSAANATAVIAKDNTVLTRLCVTAAQGNKAAMHNAIKASGYTKSYVVNNVKCNNQSITTFIAQYGKSSQPMNKMLDRAHRAGKVSVTDLAKL